MTNLIIKLILFPFLALLFLLKGIAALFRSDQSVHIPKIVEKLAAERGPFATAINELTFDQVLAYASQKAAVTVQEPSFFEFEIDVEGKRYHTAITRAPDGSNCAIFRCRPATNHSVAVTPAVQALPRVAMPSVKKNSEAGEESQNEIAELASVVNGLNAIFDKHAEKIKW